MRTGVDTNRKVFRDSSPTLGAELGCVLGRDFDYFPSSLRRFEAKYIEETKPCHIPYRPIETTPAIKGIQLLYINSVIVSEKPIGSLEVEVPSLVSDLLMGLGNKDSSFRPSLGALLFSGKPLLSHSKSILRLLKEAGVFYFSAVGGGEKGLAAHINADRLANLGQRSFGHVIAGEAGEPFTARASANCYGLYVPLDGAGEPEFEYANLPDSEVFAFELPSSLLEGEAIIPISALEARESRFAIAILNPAKEASIGFVKPFQHLLEHLGVYFLIFREGCFEFRKLVNLVIAGDRASILLVYDNALLKGGIVEKPTKVKPMFCLLEVLGICLNTIFEGLFHLPCTMFNITYFTNWSKV